MGLCCQMEGEILFYYQQKISVTHVWCHLWDVISICYTHAFQQQHIVDLILYFFKAVLPPLADWKVAGCQKDFNVSRQHVTTPFSMDCVPCCGLNLLLNGES